MKSKTRKASLPHVIERGGIEYVRLNYTHNGKAHRKERRLADRSSYAQTLLDLRQDIQSELSAPVIDPSVPQTVGALLDHYLLHKKPILKWYQQPIRETQITYAKEPNHYETIAMGELPLEALDSQQGYGILLAFKAAREAVMREKITKERGVNPITGKPNTVRVVQRIPRKPATIHKELEVLRRIVIYGMRGGWLNRNPFLRGDTLMPKTVEEQRDRIPTADEEARLLARCVDERAHLRGVLIMAADTGLRRKWLLSLRWPQIDFEKGVIDMTPLMGRQKRNKKFPRFVGLTPRALAELKTMRAQWQGERADSPQRDDRLFPFKDFKRAYATACRLAGVTGLQFRDWRHYFATRAIRAGVKKGLAMKAMGHTAEETFDIYLNLDAGMAREIAETIGRLEVAEK